MPDPSPSTTASAGSSVRTAPFGFLRPAVGLAAVYAAACVVWIAVGTLPGGRWLAVHLFTLGVVTNLVAALTGHFAQTVLHTPDRRGPGLLRLAVLNLATVGVLAGIVAGSRVTLGAGATLSIAAVSWLYADLRRMRKASLTGRFAFVVRAYERACGAFTHGALLGALLGTGLLAGSWHSGARLAHMHVMVLGWGGLTLLATVVFFGPTMMRTRIADGAEQRGAQALRHAATGLTVGALGLLATGADGWVAGAGRALAVAGLGVYAVGASVVCADVFRAARRARKSAHARLIAAACAWLGGAVWADVLIVGAGRWRLLDALGAVLLAGVLAQAILASLGYLSPMVWPAADRAAARDRLDRLPRARAAVYNIGIALVLAAALAGSGAGSAGAAASRSGWTLIAAVGLLQAALTAHPQRTRA